MRPEYPEACSMYRYALLGGAAFCNGFVVGPLVDVALGLNPAMVLTAFMATASIFACFSGAGGSPAGTPPAISDLATIIPAHAIHYTVLQACMQTCGCWLPVKLTAPLLACFPLHASAAGLIWLPQGRQGSWLSCMAERCAPGVLCRVCNDDGRATGMLCS